MFRRIFLFRRNADIVTVFCPAEEGHVAKSKVQMEAGQDRGQPILWQYWSGRCSSSPVLLCSGDCLCLLYCDRCGGEGEARCGAGLVNTGEQELGTGGWRVAILLMNPGLAAVRRGGGIL